MQALKFGYLFSEEKWGGCADRHSLHPSPKYIYTCICIWMHYIQKDRTGNCTRHIEQVAPPFSLPLWASVSVCVAFVVSWGGSVPKSNVFVRSFVRSSGQVRPPDQCPVSIFIHLLIHIYNIYVYAYMHIIYTHTHKSHGFH